MTVEKISIENLVKGLNAGNNLSNFDDLYSIENINLLEDIVLKELSKAQATRQTNKIKMKKRIKKGDKIKVEREGKEDYNSTVKGSKYKKNKTALPGWIFYLQNMKRQIKKYKLASFS